MEKNIFAQHLPHTKYDKFKFYQEKNKIGNIHLIDNICGSGKTTYIIEQIKSHLKENPNQKFIIVVTLISEIERFQIELSKFNFKTPEAKSHKDSKEYSFLRLIKNNQNIVTTHRLMQQYKPDLYSYMRNYILVIDEELQVIKPFFIKQRTLTRLFKFTKELHIDENGKLTFNLANDLEQFNESEEDPDIIKALKYMKKGSLYAKYENEKILYLSWHLDPQFIIKPKMTILISYRFKNSLFYAWSQFHNIKYKYLNIEKLNEQECNILKQLKTNINIIKDISFVTPSKKEKNNIKKLRNYLKTDYALATSHFFKKGKFIADYRKSLLQICYNYFMKNNIDKKNDVFITCLKDVFETGKIKNGDFKNSIGLIPKGFTKAKFVASTTRATNKYSNKHWILYFKNIFLNPYLNQYLQANNIKIDENEYALSELIQLIFRSAVRNNEQVNIIIPSKRMRNILNNWLSNL